MILRTRSVKRLIRSTSEINDSHRCEKWAALYFRCGFRLSTSLYVGGGRKFEVILQYQWRWWNIIKIHTIFNENILH